MPKSKPIPKEDRIGQLTLSKAGGAVMIFLDDGKVGMVSVKSMQRVLSRVRPGDYAVIKIPRKPGEGE